MLLKFDTESYFSQYTVLVYPQFTEMLVTVGSHLMFGLSFTEMFSFFAYRSMQIVNRVDRPKQISNLDS